jgi:hypothetical protein
MKSCMRIRFIPKAGSNTLPFKAVKIHDSNSIGCRGMDSRILSNSTRNQHTSPFRAGLLIPSVGYIPRPLGRL